MSVAIGTSGSTSAPRRIWFHRHYRRLTGGHLKHAHYYDHVNRLQAFERRIVFGGTPVNSSIEAERSRLWPTSRAELVPEWNPETRDVLFLAGIDWRYLTATGLLACEGPRINLIQHVRHAHPGTELRSYLGNRAIRICVSAEVADAISATGQVRGPIYTIPNGTDCMPFEPTEEAAAIQLRPERVTIVGYKCPELATDISEQLHEERIPHRLLDGFIDRAAFLDCLRRTRIAVCLPRAEEGFYLPALEAMAAGCIVVTVDCIGNRSFCRHEDNCLVAHPDPQSLVQTIKTTADRSPTDFRRMLYRARHTVLSHSLESERKRFLGILHTIDELWKDAQ